MGTNEITNGRELLDVFIRNFKRSEAKEILGVCYLASKSHSSSITLNLKSFNEERNSRNYKKYKKKCKY